MGELGDVIKRKVKLVLEIVNETPADAPQRAGAYAATRLLMDDIEKAIENPEFAYQSNGGGQVDVRYILGEVSHLRGYVEYYFGMADFTDIKPGNAEQIHHFAYKLLGLV